MENGENQHTFIRRSEIAFPSERDSVVKWDIIKRIWWSPCLTVSHVSRQCSTLKDSVWFCAMISDYTYCIFFVSRILKDLVHSFYLVFARSFYLAFISYVFHRWTFNFNSFMLAWNISNMVSCHFSVCHFTLIHSHKLSNRIYLLHELSLFIYSLSYTHPFSAEDWLLGRTFISELRNSEKQGHVKTLCRFAAVGHTLEFTGMWSSCSRWMSSLTEKFHALIVSIPHWRYAVHYLNWNASQTMPTVGICVRCFLGFLHHETRFPVRSRRSKPAPNVH